MPDGPGDLGTRQTGATNASRLSLMAKDLSVVAINCIATAFRDHLLERLVDLVLSPVTISEPQMSEGIQATARPLADEISIVKIEITFRPASKISPGGARGGANQPYKDAKLFPGGSCEWNWRETATEHVPGIQIADVQELLDRGRQGARALPRDAAVPRSP